ncbi:MAG: sulfur carrier protein ThiS [Planctomycetota bacterium]|jgi:sulfur carrier protein
MGKLKVNGVEKEFGQAVPATIAQLLEQLNVKADTVVAEIDGTIIEREKFNEIVLHDGQKVELIRFMPGG